MNAVKTGRDSQARAARCVLTNPLAWGRPVVWEHLAWFLAIFDLAHAASYVEKYLLVKINTDWYCALSGFRHAPWPSITWSLPGGELLFDFFHELRARRVSV